jgi:heat shock protein HtpX
MFVFAKRVFLFLVVNLLFMLTLGVVFSILSAFFPALQGGGYTGMLMLASLVGFGGALFGLMTSKWMAKRLQGVQVIDPATATGDERWLIQTTYRLAKEAGIETMPEVGIWSSPEINAFCTGPSKNSSLLAVSTGILQHMNKEELEGVLGHELSHAANGDMVTMTLIQGVVNTFVFMATIVISNFLRGNRDSDERGIGDFFMQHMIFNLVHMVLGLVAFVAVIGPFSRFREFRADAGGARLAGKQKMIAGLQALLDQHRVSLPSGAAAPELAAFKIDNPGSSLFSTHPSLELRIARLREMTIVR